MINLPVGARGRALAVAILIGFVGALWLAVAAPLLDWYAQRADALDRRQSLAARMEVLVAALPRLRREAAGIASNLGTQALLEGASDSLAAAAMQSQLDVLAGRSSFALSSAEVLPVEAAGAYRRVSLRFTGAGSWPAVVGLLQAIDETSPRMVIDDLQLQPSPSIAAGATELLAATFTVIAFRSGTPG